MQNILKLPSIRKLKRYIHKNVMDYNFNKNIKLNNK